MKKVEKIQRLQQEMNSIIVEREREIEGSLAALLSGSHILLLGPPGTAKSLMADLLCKSIDGAEYFQWLVTKFSNQEELFGPISLKSLETDEYRRITKGKLPTAHIAFIDEIFKANSAILNSLLTLINERRFHNNGGAAKVPLLTCFGASNELPQGEELGALYDRFVLRYWVTPIEDDGDFADLLTGKVGDSKPTTKLTLEEIEKAQQEVAKVAVSDQIIETLVQIRRTLQRKGVTVSDRRWKNAVKILRALAYLRGLSEVTNDELEILADILWDDPAQRKTVHDVVAPLSNPLRAKALEYSDAAKEILKIAEDANWDLVAVQAAHKQLKEISAKIKDDVAGRAESLTKPLTEVQAQVQKSLKILTEKAFA